MESREPVAQQPENVRRDVIRDQVVHILETQGALTEQQLFSRVSCNISYADFRNVLKDLLGEEKVIIRPEEKITPTVDVLEAAS